MGQAPGSSPTPTPAVRAQFFAGSVTEVDDQHITVSRTLVGHAPEKRTFLISGKTRMRKSLLALNARVTVRYQHLPEGDVALEIQVHRAGRTAKPS